MTIAEQLADRIFDAIEVEIADPYTIFEALKEIMGIITSFTVGLDDPAVLTRLKDVDRAITNLQQEVIGVANNAHT